MPIAPSATLYAIADRSLVLDKLWQNTQCDSEIEAGTDMLDRMVRKVVLLAIWLDRILIAGVYADGRYKKSSVDQH